MIQRVKVWGEKVEVSVHQKSKTAWVASGTYLGHIITTQDRSPATAAKRWAEAASYRTN